MTISIAVLISGGGTTLRNFIARIAGGQLPARISGVVSSKRDVKGLDIARDAGIPVAVVPRKEYPDTASFSEAVDAALDPFHPDLVVMGGFLSLWTIPPRYAGKVLNIHPALIPAFCGKGYYGLKVHEAVVESGVKVTGCTVHFADNVYDHGPIVIQRVVPVRAGDTPEEVQARVFEQECEAYPEAIRLFAEGRLKVVGRRVFIDEGR